MYATNNVVKRQWSISQWCGNAMKITDHIMVVENLTEWKRKAV